MASCRNGSQLFPSFRQCSATNEPPPLIDDTIPPPLPAARLQSGVAAARYTCENYEDDGETSGDEDVMASTFVHVLPEEDDGWESGEDLTASSRLAAFVDDTALVEEVKALYATTQDKDSLRIALPPILRSMFSEHPDPYGLLVTFLKRGGKMQGSATLALPRVALAEFRRWLEEQDGWKELKPLSQEHREQALDAFTYCPPCIFDDLCSTYDLKSTGRCKLLLFVQTLQDLGKYKEAAVAIKKFGLQADVPLQNVVIPLIAQDMINVIEDYLSGEKVQQLEFIRLLDVLCIPGELSIALKKNIGVDNTKDTSKLNVPQLYKLGIRMARLYSIDLKTFPNLIHIKYVKLMRQLLHYRYAEGAIVDDNFEELVELAVGGSVKLQQELLYALVQYKDIKMAAHYAVLYNVEAEKQPSEVVMHLARHGRRFLCKPTIGTRFKGDFLELSLPLNLVVFVDSFESLKLARKTLTKENGIIGVDAEWNLVSSSERLALFQLAVQDSVFLLDMLNLPKVVSQYELNSFFVSIFGNHKILKLGYQIDGDLNMLARSLKYVANVLACPKRVVDLKILAANLQAFNCSEELPEHPVLKSFTKGSFGGSREAKGGLSDGVNSEVKGGLSDGGSSEAKGGLSNGGGSEDKGGLSDGGSSEAKGGLSDGGGSEAKGGLSDGGGSEAKGGLSALVHRYLGKPLDKSQQISNWDRRPLKPDQVKYAALDAFCLLELHKALRAEALGKDPLFNVEPLVTQLPQCKDLVTLIVT